MTKINNTFKMLYVLAIFMIVDGHIGGFDYLNLNEYLPYQNYHIALFTFTSGYCLNLSRNYKDFILTKTTKLLLPLYIWNFLYGLLVYYLNHHQGFKIGDEFNAYSLFYAPIVDGHQYIYNMATWFLIPLFLIQILSFIILKPFADKNGLCSKQCAGLFFIVVFILGILTLSHAAEHQGKRDIILTLLRTMYFLPSFALGFAYRHCLEKYDNLSTPLYIIIILSLITLLCYIYPQNRHIPSWLDYTLAPAWVLYAISFLSILFWLRIAKIFSPIYEKSATLKYISNHTFDIMLHHFTGFMLIKAMFSGMPDFNMHAFKTNIWYMYFPNQQEELFQLIYIFITIVISLLIGYTSHQIYAILKNKIVEEKD